MERISTMPGSPGVIWGIKAICKECSLWTLNPAHDSYRCCVGDCPVIQREEMYMQSGDEGQTEWEKINRPEVFIKYTLAHAYRLMDEVYDVAKEHKIDLHDYLPAAIKGAFATKEEEKSNTLD